MNSPLVDTIPRGNDPTGHGYYGAKRGTRKHQGFDLLAEPGVIVISPIDGFITKIGQVYRATTKFKYIEISNDIYRVRLMYGKPIKDLKINKRVQDGVHIGHVQDIAQYHGGNMKNHLHVQVWKHGLLTDPEPLIIKL